MISVIKHETVDIELEEVAFMTTVNVVDAPFIVLGVILDTLEPLPDHVYVYHPEPPVGITVHTVDVRVCVLNSN
jgi:hypothetical protein